MNWKTLPTAMKNIVQLFLQAAEKNCIHCVGNKLVIFRSCDYHLNSFYITLGLHEQL